MKIAIVSLFPELIEAFASTSVVARGRAKGAIEILCEPLRSHGLGRHLSVDDTPYGGGSGMVLRVDCVTAAMDAAEARFEGRKPLRVLLTPQGQPFCQAMAESFVAAGSLILVCGRYEGFDERVRAFVDVEVSLGDFVLAGGEVAAMAVTEACVRLVPGVLGNLESVRWESFSHETGGLLEFPHYTRPAEFRGLDVPEVLLSGDHAAIGRWRQAQSMQRTSARRPDLMDGSARGQATQPGVPRGDVPSHRVVPALTKHAESGQPRTGPQTEVVEPHEEVATEPKAES